MAQDISVSFKLTNHNLCSIAKSDRIGITFYSLESRLPIHKNHNNAWNGKAYLVNFQGDFPIFFCFEAPNY